MTARLNIGAVAERTGLSEHALRAWERRYAALRPTRTEGRQRQYTEHDVERLSLLKRLCDAGHQIGRIAALPLEELRRLAIGTTGAVTPHARGAARRALSPSDVAAACRTAVSDLDTDRLSRQLEESRRFIPLDRWLDRVVLPLLRWIGDEWRAGRMTIAAEHAATAAVRGAMDRQGSEIPVPRNAPRLVVATPPGETHELGALASRLIALDAGWRVTYLGADLPPDDIAAAAAGANAVALAVTMPPADDGPPPACLHRLRNAMPANTELWLGGPAAAELARRAGWPDTCVLKSLDDLRRRLAATAPNPTRARPSVSRTPPR